MTVSYQVVSAALSDRAYKKSTSKLPVPGVAWEVEWVPYLHFRFMIGTTDYSTSSHTPAPDATKEDTERLKDRLTTNFADTETIERLSTYLLVLKSDEREAEIPRSKIDHLVSLSEEQFQEELFELERKIKIKKISNKYGI